MKKIQKWVEYDNILTKHKNEMKDTVEKKKELEESILKYVEDNKYEKLTINITDGNIKFGKRNITQPLSMKTLKTILEKYNQEKEPIDVTSLLKYIDDSLEVKQKIIMNRDITIE